MSRRNPAVLGVWGANGTRVVAAESYWKQPLRWNKEAKQAGERRRVFCGSLMDVFEGPETMADGVFAITHSARERLWDVIEQTPWLDWLLLTKRPENMRRYIPLHWWSEWPENVWAGTTVEDQAQADKRIPHLLRVPTHVRFLSCEPLLGPVDLRLFDACERISWVICGGESGPHARPMHPDWARSLKDQCQAAGVPFFFKQGSQANWTTVKAFESFPVGLRVREFPDGSHARGKE